MEIAPGVLQTQNGKTAALGQTWEPGSTFKQEGSSLRLVEGTAFVSNFGGIVREGGEVPVRFVDDGGKVKPVGLDFDRLAVGTTMKIQAPVTIEGFGKLLGGDMTFKGAAKAPGGTTVGKFQFTGAQVQLDGALGETLGLSSPANLIRASFVVESAVMNLKSAEVQSKDKRLFVQESKPAIDLTGVGLMVVFPVSSVSGIVAGFAADQGLQAAGVNEDLAGIMGIATGMLVGGRVATSTRISSLENAWAARTGANQSINHAVQGFKAGFKEVMQGTKKVAQSEAGHVLAGPAVANKALGVAGKSQAPVSPQAHVLDVLASGEKSVNFATPSRLAGAKSAVQFLKDQGISLSRRRDILSTFEVETIKLRYAGKNEYAIRYFDDIKAGARGRYLFKTFPATRDGMALKTDWSGGSKQMFILNMENLKGVPER